MLVIFKVSGANWLGCWLSESVGRCVDEVFTLLCCYTVGRLKTFRDSL